MFLRIAALALAVLIISTSNAYAYIDPGTGSVATTAIIGFFAAAGYTLRKYFYRMKDMFSSKSSKSTSTDRKSNQ